MWPMCISTFRFFSTAAVTSRSVARVGHVGSCDDKDGILPQTMGIERPLRRASRSGLNHSSLAYLLLFLLAKLRSFEFHLPDIGSPPRYHYVCCRLYERKGLREFRRVQVNICIARSVQWFLTSLLENVDNHSGTGSHGATIRILFPRQYL
jgi:hypothetical protein